MDTEKGIEKKEKKTFRLFKKKKNATLCVNYTYIVFT